MGLDIYFREDVANALLALAQANEQALDLAERYGMNPEAARLCREVYAGALRDVAASFSLSLGPVLISPHIHRIALFEGITG